MKKFMPSIFAVLSFIISYNVFATPAQNLPTIEQLKIAINNGSRANPSLQMIAGSYQYYVSPSQIIQFDLNDYISPSNQKFDPSFEKILAEWYPRDNGYYLTYLWDLYSHKQAMAMPDQTISQAQIQVLKVYIAEVNALEIKSPENARVQMVGMIISFLKGAQERCPSNAMDRVLRQFGVFFKARLEAERNLMQAQSSMDSSSTGEPLSKYDLERRESLKSDINKSLEILARLGFHK